MYFLKLYVFMLSNRWQCKNVCNLISFKQLILCTLCVWGVGWCVWGVRVGGGVSVYVFDV